MSDEMPLNGRVETVERPSAAPMPGGPDWTREYGEVGGMLNQAPNPQIDDMVTASAYGRAKGALLDALAAGDTQQFDRVVLKLVRFALEGADARTILTGLL